jgi:hypothetical protein
MCLGGLRRLARCLSDSQPAEAAVDPECRGVDPLFDVFGERRWLPEHRTAELASPPSLGAPSARMIQFRPSLEAKRDCAKILNVFKSQRRVAGRGNHGGSPPASRGRTSGLRCPGAGPSAQEWTADRQVRF